MSRTQGILIALVAIVAAAAGMLLARGVLHDPGVTQTAMVAGTLLQPPRPVPPFSLVDHEDRPFDAARLQNRWTLLFFGFTNCPDVCPATLTVLAQLEKQLADMPAALRPQIVLVSVDPKRDTPEQLSMYVKYFSASFVGVTGTQESIDDFAKSMSVPIAIHDLGNGAYTVDHSAAIFLLDPNGDMRALFSTPHDPASIAADYRRVVTR